MKKLKVLFPAAALFFAVQSCQKAEVYQEVALTQTINQNESYTFELPATDDPYRILQEAQHATISLIGLSAEGNPIYSYTPAADFIGNDLVILQTYHNQEGKKGKGHHGKGKHREEEDLTTNYPGGGFCGTGNQTDEVKEDRRGKCGNESNSNTEDDYTVTITIQVVETTNVQNMKTTL